jgi:hypothetical protein
MSTYNIIGRYAACGLAGLIAAAMAAAQESLPAAAKTAIGVTPQTEAAIAAGLPVFVAKKIDLKTEVVPADSVAADTAASGAVQMPDFVLSSPKLPDAEEVMTRVEMEKMAMNRFLGSETGIDRGFLNLITIDELWQRIPVLGRFEFLSSVTNEQRATAMYRAEKQAELFAEFSHLSALAKKAGIAVAPASAP